LLRAGTARQRPSSGPAEGEKNEQDKTTYS